MRYKGMEEIAGRYGIIMVYLFGSQADKGKKYLSGEDVKPDTFSDLDIAITFEKPPEEVIRTYGELYKEISGIFGPFNIDLVFIHEVNPLFRYEIIKGVRIYEKDV